MILQQGQAFGSCVTSGVCARVCACGGRVEYGIKPALLSYTNLRRTNSKWHLNWSRWKALWTGSKGWYFHAGVKTNLLAYTPSSFSFFLTHIYTHARPQHEVESVGLAAFLQICKASYLTGFLVYQFS